jgi:FkbM family methyltransferase
VIDTPSKAWRRRGSGARRTFKRLLAHNHAAYRWARRVFMFGRYACGRPHEADFAAFRRFPQRTGLFLDIGANSGESVLSFRLFNPTAPILSIEPNRYHEPDLRFLKQWVRNFDYLLCAAGDRTGSATLYVPVYRDLPLTGEASFYREQALGNYWVREHVDGDETSAVRLIEVPVEVKRLDDLALTPDFIKIDVQGFEAKVVAGLRRTIARSQPVLLVERSGCDDALYAQLVELGYTAFVYASGVNGFSPYRNQAAQNLFFLPDHTRIPSPANEPARLAGQLRPR